MMQGTCSIMHSIHLLTYHAADHRRSLLRTHCRSCSEGPPPRSSCCLSTGLHTYDTHTYHITSRCIDHIASYRDASITSYHIQMHRSHHITSRCINHIKQMHRSHHITSRCIDHIKQMHRSHAIICIDHITCHQIHR